MSMLPDGPLRDFLNYAAQTTIAGAGHPYEYNRAECVNIDSISTRVDRALEQYLAQARHHALNHNNRFDTNCFYCAAELNSAPTAPRFVIDFDNQTFRHVHDGISCHYVHGRCDLNNPPMRQVPGERIVR